MGLIYGAGFQPLMILVNLPPWGAAPGWYETRLRRFIALENDRSVLAQMYKLQATRLTAWFGFAAVAVRVRAPVRTMRGSASRAYSCRAGPNQDLMRYDSR